MKHLKRYFSIFMVITMVIAMTAACGKENEETAAPEQTETEAAVESELATESESDDAPAEVPAEVEAEVQVEDSSETETANSDAETLSEEDIIALKASIRDSVINEYLVPNGIAPEDFVWPESGNPAWQYGNKIITIYLANNFSDGDGPQIQMDLTPGNPEEEIVSAIYNGIINWHDATGNSNYNYFANAMASFEEMLPTIDLTSE